MIGLGQCDSYHRSRPLINNRPVSVQVLDVNSVVAFNTVRCSAEELQILPHAFSGLLHALRHYAHACVCQLP